VVEYVCVGGGQTEGTMYRAPTTDYEKNRGLGECQR
jgi:hypothetical protein